MTTSWPESLGTIYGGVLTLAARVRDMSGGCFTITPYAAGELVPGLQVLNAVQSGSVECGHTASYYYIYWQESCPVLRHNIAVWPQCPTTKCLAL